MKDERIYKDTDRVIINDGDYRGQTGVVQMLWDRGPTVDLDTYLITVQIENGPLIFVTANQLVLWKATNQAYESAMRDLDELM